MKPHELVAALMARDGLGALPLAKAMGKPKLQPQIYRFVAGGVREPSRATAEPIATHFGIPIDAIYDEKVATRVGNELKLTVLPVPPPKPRRQAKTAAPPGLSDEAIAHAFEYDKLSPAAKQRLRLLMLAAPEGKQPTEAWRAPGRPRKGVEEPDSGLSDLDDVPAPPAGKKRSRK